MLAILPQAVAATAYLAVGGGYSTFSSQVALEKNIELFQSTLQPRLKPTDIVQTLYGAGHHTDSADVIETNPGFPLNDLLFAQLFDACESPECRVRHNKLTSIDGPATRAEILDQIELAQERLKTAPQSSHFRFYFTGHGSPGRTDSQIESGERRYLNNVMDTWKSGKINVQDFTEALDHFPIETDVQVVMVQCYSGGFANLINTGGLVPGKLSPARRCGFFSQLPDRVASGCTLDLRIREEYSPYFFAAYQGKTESGQPVDADYNKDGKITSDEAHAYVIIHENAVDIPVTTSNLLLRHMGWTLDMEARRASWTQFKALMNPIERAVAEGLSSRLGFDLESSPSPLRATEEQVETWRKLGELTKSETQKAQEQVDQIQRSIVADLSPRFAIFHNTWGANQGAGFQPQSATFQSAKEALEKHPLFEAFQTAHLSTEQAFKKQSLWEKKKVLWERLAPF